MIEAFWLPSIWFDSFDSQSDDLNYISLSVFNLKLKENYAKFSL